MNFLLLRPAKDLLNKIKAGQTDPAGMISAHLKLTEAANSADNGRYIFAANQLTNTSRFCQGKLRSGPQSPEADFPADPDYSSSFPEPKAFRRTK
jgi:hypothetical protein